MSAPLLSIENMVVSFGGQSQPAVRGVSLDVHRGEILALVGESASGKSVTVKSVMRLIDFQGGRITGGRIILSGKEPVDLAAAPEPVLRRLRGARIAMIFQDPMTSLNPVMTIGAQLTEAIRQHGRAADAQVRALAMLEQVRLSDPERRMAQYPHELSGGMRQRVMIAMALVCEPDLLIADEPTTALDVTVQAEILGLIRGLQKQNGMAVLFITHDMGVVAEIADRVAVMLQGEIVEEGTVQKVFDAPRHAYTRKLLDAAPKFREGGTATPVEVDRAAPVLSVHHLTARYPVRSRLLRRHIANVHAVEDVSFDLHPGETVAIIGESGCGKSSLAKSLLRLLPVAEGRAFLAGRDLLTLEGEHLRAARADIQMVFQDPYAALDPRMSIRQILSEPLRIRGLPVEGALLEALIARVGLPEGSLDRYPHQFSGGQRQRICIARALVLRPKVLIADEPVSALDVAIQSQILDLLKSFQRDDDLAMLFISHDMAVVERVADRIVVMYRGRIVEEGPAYAVLGQPSHPYTRRLLQAVPVSHPRRRMDRAPMGEPTPSPIFPLGSTPALGSWRQIGQDHRVWEA
ncbi:ABC transporter ATP-binding protein [Haematobacter genomosp. 1]|uniref:ABC transporter ATP-binding protein n=1 Tax=Haematobacter genomosp. 1 TaxID=366618 RepID=A0A212ABF9_9RHOB|nr:ABC transporter ATP-binding protein [Haematobacter genomosp. 1]OWJ77942.1 ABC transporter ATP-binding protein [Haematobacter genomosp. 1]